MIYPKTALKLDSIASHYDSLDPLYRSLWGENLHHGLWIDGTESVERAQLQLIERIAFEANVQPLHRVCDIGCGYGGTAGYMERHCGAEVTGLTISEAQWKIAQERCPRQKFILGDFLNNALPDQEFDAAISIESSEHMIDKRKFFQEAFRILKPGGRFVVAAWLCKDAPRDWEIRYLLEPICREGRLPSLGSEQDYLFLMREVGFQQIESSDLSRFVKKTWSIVIQKIAKALFKNRELRRYLLNRNSSDRIFAKTVLRLFLAYNLSSFRYCLFSAHKP